MKLRGYQWPAPAALAAAVVLAGPQAGAVVYSSAFDPPNFRGTATFDVSQACLNVGTGSAFNGVGGCTVTWLTATVTFQDAPGLTFDYSHLLSDSSIVSEIYVSAGELAGIISGALGPRIITSADTTHGPFQGPWWIQYQFDPPSVEDLLGPLDGPPSSGAFGLGVVYLYSGECFVEPEPFCRRFQDPAETADVLNFTRVAVVPEPGSLALLLAALAGAGCARRRTSAKA